MFTVVRYSVMWSPSTTALIETTSAPEMPRRVFAASCTAASAAFAKLSGEEPMIVITFATSAISASQRSFAGQSCNRGDIGANRLLHLPQASGRRAVAGRSDLRDRARLGEPRL